ncbi:MAG: hypothetical protein C3F14_08185, partial [Deltaproteobacteria bacterium]
MRSRFLAGCALLPALLFSLSGECAAQGSPASPVGIPASSGETISLSVSSMSPEEGEPVLVEVAVSSPVDNLSIAWKGRTYPMMKMGPGRFLALVGVDLMDPPGEVPLSIAMAGTGPGMRLTLDLTVREKRFP